MSRKAGTATNSRLWNWLCRSVCAPQSGDCHQFPPLELAMPIGVRAAKRGLPPIPAFGIGYADRCARRKAGTATNSRLWNWLCRSVCAPQSGDCHQFPPLELAMPIGVRAAKRGLPPIPAFGIGYADRCARRKAGTATNSRLWNWLCRSVCAPQSGDCHQFPPLELAMPIGVRAAKRGLPPIPAFGIGYADRCARRKAGTATNSRLWNWLCRSVCAPQSGDCHQFPPLELAMPIGVRAAKRGLPPIPAFGIGYADRCARRKAGTATNSRLWNWLCRSVCAPQSGDCHQFPPLELAMPIGVRAAKRGLPPIPAFGIGYADRCVRRKAGTDTNSRFWNWLAVPGLPQGIRPRVCRLRLTLVVPLNLNTMLDQSVPEQSEEMPEPAVKGTTSIPVAGIGGSAGGLEVFKHLLADLPADTGLAIVFVQHLDPKHHSLLSEILARSTTMAVREAADGMPVEANHVYVIPPNSDLTIGQGLLRLAPRAQDPGPHMPIDRFLRSLAEECGSRAIGVILSGAGTDGAAGIQAIKAAGGVTFAQDQYTAKFASMPQAAVATNCVD